jgi:hypothetical protein
MFYGLNGALAPVAVVIAITLIVGSGLVIGYGYGYSYTVGPHDPHKKGVKTSQDKNNQASNSNKDQYVPFELPFP